MSEAELKALISLLDDNDREVSFLVEKEIRQQGDHIIPLLETKWEEESLNPIFQRRIEELIHNMQYEQVLERLKKWHNGGAEDLLEGLWILATYQYPELTLAKLRDQLDQFFYEAWVEFKPEMHPVDQIRTLNHVFFNKLKFGSNTKNFHSPSNSMINVVLDSRLGNPISLCCLYMLIAKRLKMPVFGVNLPNLFVLTYKYEAVQFYINAFNKGLVFMRSDIDHYIGQLGLKPQELFYEPCTNVDIIMRVLRNLIMAFDKLHEHEKMAEIERMVKLLQNPK